MSPTLYIRHFIRRRSYKPIIALAATVLDCCSIKEIRFILKFYSNLLGSINETVKRPTAHWL